MEDEIEFVRSRFMQMWPTLKEEDVEIDDLVPKAPLEDIVKQV